MTALKLTLEYDGTSYAGWQRQPDHPTIQATLEAAIGTVTHHSIAVIGAGRTDSGVHGLGQVASFHTDNTLSANEWKRALNGILPPDICVLAAETVPNEFHARYSARRKLYEYRILNRSARTALDRHRVWHVSTPLDLAKMEEAAKLLVGRNDCTSFQGSATDNENPICVVNTVELTRNADRIHIQIEANRFLKHMVRAIVGTLVEVGQGKREPQNLKGILEARDRRAAGFTAPPQGLFLVKVEY